MSYTKRQLILAAMSEIGLSSYSFDLSADQIEQALFRLDAMIAEWSTQGIRLGYPLPSSPELSNAYDESNVPSYAQTAVITNLAIQLAPSYGKIVSQQTMASARGSLNLLLARFVKPSAVRLGPLPAGAGHKDIDTPFLEQEESPVLKKPDSSISFG